ncbi:hypothetical protein N665_0354s0043 [Sinapis alba]|nr:hypothetical protein N665_0354s0043 [Sinapis alba]
MAKPENDDVFPEKQPWGTWEELLLACAVHRHGTESWTSVSAEIQKRSPNLSSLTASACRHKYFDLKRRFTQEMDLTESEISTVPWLDELRKLRVDELRREVERYDLSISSLQSKVKRLEEEREMRSDLDKREIRRESDCDAGELIPISLDPVDISPGTGSVNVKREEEIAGGEAKLTGEDSCRGSCESVEKETGVNSERVEPGRVIELTESEGKETSDVQSSASLPRKGTSEVDKEDQSPSARDFNVESQPSISFVEMLLSHPCGSHFSRRLETQETPEYGKIIRQHIDFEMIRKRDQEGCYKSSMSKLFRDLLLLINNAKVFYHKGSSEFNSAEQLHQLVKKQMNTTLKRPREKISPPPKEKSLELVSFKEAVTVTSKPRISLPIIACRKRSSLAAKSPLLMVSSSPSGTDKKGKKTDQVVDDDADDVQKLVLLKKDEKETSGKDDESLVLKKMVRGKTSSAKKVAISNRTDEEKKKKGSSKKKSVASFLKRMKGGSSSDTVVETLKPSSEQKKNNISKADAKKRVTGENQTNEKGSPVKKKNNGRALKREAAPSSPSPSPVIGKRSRESGKKKEAFSSSPSTRLKKRVRR